MSKVAEYLTESLQDPSGIWSKTDDTLAVDLSYLRLLDELSEPGEPDLIVELIDLYLEEGPRRLKSLRAACENRDSVALKNSAHNLKGSSGNLGALLMAEVCHQLEQLAYKKSFTEATEVLSALEHEFGRVQKVLLAERETRC
jgi:HPt (histidine-containing phosphotransfer) domain-containing protein